MGKSVVLVVIFGMFFTGWCRAADTGALVPAARSAVTSSAGDNNGFEATFGSTTPIDYKTSNNSGVSSVNSGTASSTSCALPNTASDQDDFRDFSISLPAGAKATGITLSVEGRYDSTSGTNTICAFLSYNGGTNWTAGKNTADIGNVDVTSTLGSTSDTWGRTWTAAELNNTNFRVRIMPLVGATSRDYFLDLITIRVTYNLAPNAPTQAAPANSATNVSINPTFTMSATDPDAPADKLGYKVTVYSNSGCTTVVRTHDQAVDATGWSGQNATCTAAPTSCYTSGTQGSYAIQPASPLTNATQYWWRASAKDPDGSGSFTDSSTCNTFTTVPAVSISVTSDGSVSYGTLAAGVTRDTTAGGLNDPQTVSVDSGPANLNIKSGAFSDGSDTWTLGAANGANQAKWEFSKDGSVWNTFSVVDSLYTFDTNVAQSATRSLYLRLTMPTSFANHNPHSSTVTIVASSP